MYHFTVSEIVIKNFFPIYKSYSRSKFRNMGIYQGHQRIVSVNYLFERPLNSYNFLKRIFTSNFRDMGNFGYRK